MRLDLFAGIRVRDYDAAKSRRGDRARAGSCPQRVTCSSGVRNAIYRNADANEIGFGGGPVEP